MATLLSLTECFDFRLGRKDVKVWSPSPSKGFSYRSFFRFLPDPSLAIESVLTVMEDKIPKKVKFFYWQGLLGHVNTRDRLL